MHVNLAAILLDNGLTYVQAHSNALLVVLVGALYLAEQDKELLHLLLSDSFACVYDLNFQLLQVVVIRYRDHDLALVCEL